MIAHGGDAIVPRCDVGAAAARPPVNPFATRWTRPGRIVARDARGEPLDVVGLLGRLAESGGSGAVEGPHGSGKTTLLAALATELDRRGRLVARVRIRSRRDAAALLQIVWRAVPGSVVCIDSWEAIGFGFGIIARGLARWRRCGLIVTSHRPTGLPRLWRCETSVELLARIVASLPDEGGRMGAEDIRRSFERHEGNLRESLLDLYDTFEGRRPVPRCMTSADESAAPGVFHGQRAAHPASADVLTSLPGDSMRMGMCRPYGQ